MFLITTQYSDLSVPHDTIHIIYSTFEYNVSYSEIQYWIEHSFSKQLGQLWCVIFYWVVKINFLLIQYINTPLTDIINSLVNMNKLGISAIIHHK